MERDTRIVLEAGPTHSGLEEALRLVEVAANAGADAIKFQLVDADRLVSDRAKVIDFQVLTNGGMEHRTESLHKILKRRELAEEEWVKLRTRARNAGLGFYATAMYEDEFDFLIDTLEVDAVKVASADIDNLPLLSYLQTKEIEVHIDTGSANLWEIDRAVEILGNCVIHHVPTGYPAHTESINLRMLHTLRLMYPDHLIAFSDHSPGWEMDIAAIALGAAIVEKTITLDRHRPEIEHIFSLEPEDAKTFVEKVEELETALGSSRRVLPAHILENRRGVRRSLYLTEPVKEGEPVERVESRRPGYGISPAFQEIIRGRPAKRDLEPGLLRWEDV